MQPQEEYCHVAPYVAGTKGNFKFYYCSFLLEIIEVITRPRPNPNNVDPTNAKGDCCKKKNPAPMPISVPPPIAHVLLSSFLSVMPFSEIY